MRRAAATLAVLLLVIPGGGWAGSKQLRVGLVLQQAGVPGDPFDALVLKGFQRAARELGVQGRVVASNPRSGTLPGMLFLARQKYDLVIGYGFLEVGDMDTAALRFPHTRFAIVDASRADFAHRPGNVRGGVFASQEASYLAGYLAALMEQRRPGKHVIASIGGYRIPTVDAYIAGYQAGARRADPAITTLNAYAHDFNDPSKCKLVALDQIGRGAGVVFQVASACGLGALQAAREKGVWGVGVDSDQSSLGPFILTSAVKRLDVAVFRVVQSLVRGTFRTGGDTVFDLANGGVGLGKISPKVPRSFVRQLERIRAQIVAGKIKVPTGLRP